MMMDFDCRNGQVSWVDKIVNRANSRLEEATWPSGYGASFRPRKRVY